MAARLRRKAKGGGVEPAQKLTGVRITGGRTARKDGGRAKGKTNINIIIGGPKGAPDGAGMAPPPPSAMPPAPPMPHPVAPPQGMPPGAMGAPPPGGMPPMPPGGMPRASGGRAYPVKDSAAGGLGRLQKIKSYGP